MSNAAIEKTCSTLAENFGILVSKSKLEREEFLLAGACLFTSAGKTPEPERMDECRRLLKERENIFSSFRGMLKYLICCKLALAPAPEEYFDELVSAYNAFKGSFSGDQAVLAAVTLADRSRGERTAELAERTKAVYRDMKKAHAMITSKSDLPFAALMATSEKDCDAVFAEAEEIYGILKSSGLKVQNDTIQTLSCILAVRAGDAKEKCEKVCAIADGLKAAKQSFDKKEFFVIVGVLADSELPADELVQYICEAGECLKQYKPFKGGFGVSSDNRRLFAVQAVQFATADDALGLAATTTASVELAAIHAMNSSILMSTISACLQIGGVLLDSEKSDEKSSEESDS